MLLIPEFLSWGNQRQYKDLLAGLCEHHFCPKEVQDDKLWGHDQILKFFLNFLLKFSKIELLSRSFKIFFKNLFWVFFFQAFFEVIYLYNSKCKKYKKIYYEFFHPFLYKNKLLSVSFLLEIYISKQIHLSNYTCLCIYSISKKF